MWGQLTHATLKPYVLIKVFYKWTIIKFDFINLL